MSNMLCDLMMIITATNCVKLQGQLELQPPIICIMYIVALSYVAPILQNLAYPRTVLCRYSDTPPILRYTYPWRILFSWIKKERKECRYSEDTSTILRRYLESTKRDTDTWNLCATDGEEAWQAARLLLVLPISGVRYRRHVVCRHRHGKQPVFFWW